MLQSDWQTEGVSVSVGCWAVFTIGGAAIVVLQPGSDLYRHFVLLGGAAYCAGHLVLLPAWMRRPRDGELFAGYTIYVFFVFFACINVLAYWHRLPPCHGKN